MATRQVSTGRVVGRRAVVARRQELAHVMTRGRAGEEGLRELLWNSTTVIQELVSHYFFQIWASLRISRQNPRDEVSGCVRNVDVVGERVAVLTNASVRGFNVSGLEGRFTDDESVDDNSE